MVWFIAGEHIKKICLKEALFIAILAFVIGAMAYVIQATFSPAVTYYLFLGLFTAVLNITVYLLKKSGVAVLFSIAFAAFTYRIDDIGTLGFKKIVVFFIAALVFEAVFLVLKLRTSFVPIDMVIGSSLLAATLPLATALMLSPSTIFSFPIALLNLIALSFALGLAASAITSLLWYFISHTRFILRLEAYFDAL